MPTAAPPFDHPHTPVFAVAAVLFLMLPVITVGSKRPISWQRKVYWGGTVGAAASAFIASLPSINTGLGLAALAVGIMVIRAYFTSSYIAFGGRVFAFYEEADGSGSAENANEVTEGLPYSPTVTAAKMWWLLVVGVGGVGAGNMWMFVASREDLRYGLLGLGIVVVTGVSYGVLDAMNRQRVARGQIVPLTVLSVVSAGIFAVCYLGSHATTRWLRT